MEHLSRIGLSCRHRLFASGVDEKSFIDDFGHFGFGLVCYSERECSAFFSSLEYLIDIVTLARL